MLATRLLFFLFAPPLELPPRSEASPPLESAAAALAAAAAEDAVAPNDVDETMAPSSATTSMRWVPSDAWVRARAGMRAGRRVQDCQNVAPGARRRWTNAVQWIIEVDSGSRMRVRV